MRQKGFAHILIILLLLVLVAGAIVLFKTNKTSVIDKQNKLSESPSTQKVSPSKEGTIPAEIKSTLPTKNTEGKDISAYYISDDPNFIIFTTFVRTRGAGRENDYWSLNRKTSEQTNLSQLIKNNSEYQKAYPDNADLYLTFANRWQGDNPAFEVVNGWESVGRFWIYDITQNKFTYISE